MVISLAVADLGNNGCDVKSVVPSVALGRRKRIDLHASRAPTQWLCPGPSRGGGGIEMGVTSWKPGRWCYTRASERSASRRLSAGAP